MTVVVFVVGCMSVLLINSLLSVLLESKMFDLGIQRMLGLSSVDIVMLVLTNTYVFAVPAWFVGLIAGQLLYVLVSLLFQWETDIQLGYFVTLSSIGWSTLIAFLIPLLSSILPTRRLLNRQLADSLNSERNMESGVIYKIEQKGKQSFNRVNFGIGVLVFSFGAFAYLVLPSSLLSQNLTEMFFVFYSLLLGMLFGFVLLVLNYQRLIEGVVLHVFLFWEKSAVFNIVGKNLIFHRLRNRRTTLMYSLSLTFIIFVSVAFELESDSLVFGVSRDAGADINIRISGYDSRGRLSLKREVDMDSEKFALVDRFSQIPMTLDSLGGVLQAVSEKIADGTIAQYSYRLFPINSACAERYINNQRLNTLGRFRDLTTGIRPIAPSMFNVLFDKYQVVRKVDDDVARYGLSETLYTTANRDGVILSTSAFDHLGFDTLSDIGVVRTVAKPGVRLTGSTQGFTVAAVMDSAPVVLMNRYPGSLGDVLASIPSGAKFSMIPYLSVRSLFVNQIFFQVPDPEQYKTVTSWVESYLFQKHSYWFRNIEEQLKNFVMARGVLFYFFLVCEVMILFLCFFSLSSSMSSQHYGTFQTKKEVSLGPNYLSFGFTGTPLRGLTFSGPVPF
ncbi:permease, family protein [Angomonas deanei]|nr:permease, family protein [Angomonas deanei]|eukprot:EPY30103.1 permease, family protein [Angomonas deanei]